MLARRLERLGPRGPGGVLRRRVPRIQGRYHATVSMLEGQSAALVAALERLDGKSADRMEKVNDEQYGAPVRQEFPSPAPVATARARASRARRAISGSTRSTGGARGGT